MNALMIGIFTLSQSALAGPMEDCVDGAHSWFEGLSSEGCPVLEKYRTAAVESCRDMPEDGWTRAMKSARKAILDDCRPSKKGFPGSQASLPDGSTSSRCSELTKLVQNVDGSTPSDPAWGIDGMMAAVSTAVFVCHAPKELDLCLLSSRIETPSGQIEQRRDACANLLSPPLDTFLKSLAWNSGLMPVIPEEQRATLDALLKEQEDARKLRALEEEHFHEERMAEVERARALSDECMKLPGDMTTIEETLTASKACGELEALWRGADDIRKEKEASGIIAERYAKQLAGKVLNAESLNAGDSKRVASRPTILEERRITLVGAKFNELIEQDPEAAESLLEKYRNLMGPEWAAEAQDQLLAAEI